MHKFYGTGCGQGLLFFASAKFRSPKGQYGPKPFASLAGQAGENAIAHSLVEFLWPLRFWRQESVQGAINLVAMGLKSRLQ